MKPKKEALLGAINAVQNLHTYDDDLEDCSVCEVRWPCPTLCAINEHIDLELLNPCTYTFAHTKHWCGYPLCRDS